MSSAWKLHVMHGRDPGSALRTTLKTSSALSGSTFSQIWIRLHFNSPLSDPQIGFPVERFRER